MNCYLHADRQAELHCAACGNLICGECDVLLAHNHVCKKCLAEADSIPPQLAAATAPDSPIGAIFPKANFGSLSLALIIGGIMGVVAGTMFRHESSWRVNDVLGDITASAFAGICMYLAVAVLTYMFIPNAKIREKGGVLGLFGVQDYGVFVFVTLVIAGIVTACING